MVEPGDGKHARKVQRNRHGNRKPAGPREEHREAAEVQDHEGDAPDPVHPVGFLPHALRPSGGMVGVEPLDQGRQGAAQPARTGRSGWHGKRDRLSNPHFPGAQVANKKARPSSRKNGPCCQETKTLRLRQSDDLGLTTTAS